MVGVVVVVVAAANVVCLALGESRSLVRMKLVVAAAPAPRLAAADDSSMISLVLM